MVGSGGALGRMVVVGAGAAGLSAAWAALGLGFSVTCLEARQVGHPAASSTGWAKIFRYAYEDAALAHLLTETERRWRRLEELSGRRLLLPCPGLNIAKGGADSLAAIVRSLEAAGRTHQVIRPDSRRLDRLGVRLLPGEEAILEPAAGLLHPTAVLTALAGVVRAGGGRIVTGARVREISAGTGDLLVRTERGSYPADRVVVAAGPWAPDLVPAAPLRVTRQHQLVYATDRAIGAGRPLAWVDLDGDDAYGVVNGTAGQHLLGSHAPGPVGTPERATPADDGAEPLRAQLDGVRRRLGAGIRIAPVQRLVCHYTSTEDGRFLVANWPRIPGVVVLSACSGHGFKFVLTTGHQAATLAAG
ncbi:N-methyltryptophan oxidase [Plantactinospora mayteni]|uniref:N-methyltryptophan oxidase n=1 Tax=Plantactinospora mayteni TaxID=566021 RepID=A0ABQ4EKK6_9ACTN|nr:N-methyltryptophan oxidase [Plantactinospora mayteni]